MEFSSPAMEVVVDTPVHDDASARDARPKTKSFRRFGRGGAADSAAAGGASSSLPPEEAPMHEEAPHPSFYEGLFPKEKRILCCGRWFWWDSLYGTTAKYVGGTVLLVSLLVTTAVLLTIYVGIPGGSSVVVQSTMAPSWTPTPVPTTLPTSAPTSVQRQSLVQFLSSRLSEQEPPVSSRLELSTAETPQYRALEWLQEWARDQNQLLETPSSSSSSSSQSTYPAWIQKYILAVLYFSTGGDQWSECHARDPLCHLGNQNYPFLSPTVHECDWYGIYCRDELETDATSATTTTNDKNDDDEGKQIYQISLAYPNNMAGTLPSELAMLPHLTLLLIGRQPNMVGTIPPEWANLSQLQSLGIVHMPSLTGPVLPASFENHPSLSLLALSNGANGHAGQDGTFPTVITTLSQLKLLALLTYTNMTGPLPPKLGQLTQLEALYLDGNDFTGTIPATWGQLSNLESLDLSSNRLHGSLSPQLFANWTHMRYFNLSDNALTGSLPSPEIGSLGSTYLPLSYDDDDDDEADVDADDNDDERRQRHYDFSNNRFTGTIPPELANAQQLVHLFLDHNDFVGDVPLELCALRSPTPQDVDEEDEQVVFELQELTVDCTRVTCSCCTNCNDNDDDDDDDNQQQHHYNGHAPNRKRCEKEPWWTGCATQQERS